MSTARLQLDLPDGRRETVLTPGDGEVPLSAVLARRGCFVDRPTRVGAALLTAGILGNLTDRFLHGFVVDFLDVLLPWYGRWPAFNVADSAICIAAVLFLISSFVGNNPKTLKLDAGAKSPAK